MQHLGMRYSQQNMHVASHITCLWVTSIKIMDRWHVTLRTYQFISVIQDNVRMILWKAGYSKTNCRHQWDLNLGPLGQQANYRGKSSVEHRAAETKS